MLEIHEEYLVDEKGNAKSAVVPIEEWNEILESLEDLDDIQAFDKAKKGAVDAVPFDDFLKTLES
jgi:hypothetical protein